MSWVPGQLLVVENCSVLYAEKAGAGGSIELWCGDLVLVVGREDKDVFLHMRSGTLVTSWETVPSLLHVPNLSSIDEIT